MRAPRVRFPCPTKRKPHLRNRPPGSRLHENLNPRRWGTRAAGVFWAGMLPPDILSGCDTVENVVE